MLDECKSCGQHKFIVNKKYYVCDLCNKKRLASQRGEEYKPKTYTLKRTPLKRSKKPLKRTPIKKKISKNQIKIKNKDKLIYTEVFNFFHPITKGKCQNCGKKLNDICSVDDIIIDNFRFSHILTKQAYPEYRHLFINFNYLCFDCHQLWEFGTKDKKENMVIYDINKFIIENLTSKNILDINKVKELWTNFYL